MNPRFWGLLTGRRETLKRALHGELDGASEAEKAQAVRDIIRTTSEAASVVALQPIPFLDSPFIRPIQWGMVRGIGRVHGYRIDDHDAHEIFRPIRRHIVARHALIGGAKLVPPVIPFAGGLIAISVAYALTSALGELSDRYFRSRRTMLPAQMRLLFERVFRDQFSNAFRQKRNAIRAKMRRDPEIRRRFDIVARAAREGMLTEEEAARRTDEILAGSGPGLNGECEARSSCETAGRSLELDESRGVSSMDESHCIAVFDRHDSAEDGIRELQGRGFDMKKLSLVGRDCHTEERPLGFERGQRVKRWGKRGILWGTLFGILFAPVVPWIPGVGFVVTGGLFGSFLAGTAEGAAVGAAVGGGGSALAAALTGLGIPKDSVIQYERAVKADRFLLIAHGTATEIERARTILASAGPRELQVHSSRA
jgi:uncharacterized protein (DUF697 family)